MKKPIKELDLQKLPVSASLEWRYHLDMDRRVWRKDWASDQFTILTKEEFNKLASFCEIFSIPLEEATED